MNPTADCLTRAAAFLAGEALSIDTIRELAKACRKADHLSLARSVLSRLRTDPKAVLPGGKPPSPTQRGLLITDEALLTSKDPELAASVRHDQAIELLEQHFGDLEDKSLDTQQELMGVAGGICKRRWQDLGQLADLRRTASFYERGARGPLGDDAYCQINAAYLDDVLASLGDDTARRQASARTLRERIVAELAAYGAVQPGSRWWNAASRAEAFFGLGQYAEATASIAMATDTRPEAWQLETTVRQLAHIARLQHTQPWSEPAVFAFFDALVPGDAAAVLRAVLGRVGLALSGGGFRASFYHLGVLARLAELDVLRHVSVLSCVSGGSIVGACYWLMLRQRLAAQARLTQADYVELVHALIDHFTRAVQADLRAQVQPSRARVAWRVLMRNERGLLDPGQAADALHRYFYQPLAAQQADLPTHEPLRMDHLEFEPKGHAQKHPGTKFQPARHNWLREDKVPVLVINATTVNTGHAWQFTTAWMGESPWAVHEAADSIARLEWSWYDPASGWSIELARAVAASASVPFVFAPLELAAAYQDKVNVRLVDGGVHDNQGTVALLAQDCNVVLVSDACGQLLFEDDDPGGLGGLATYGMRSMNMLMERIRLANYGDLSSRRQVGLLSGLMFLHMKAGLDADVKRRVDSQASYEIRRTVLSPSGVRKEFQQALSDLRTDLDAFSETESSALMACGYQMAVKAAERDLASIAGLTAAALPSSVPWPFAAMLEEITSAAASTPQRKSLLRQLAAGAQVDAG
jgi:predicted acylesterase/phospholipase RssA